MTVATALGKGHPDTRVVELAKREDRILITANRGFLEPSHRRGIQVFLVADDGTPGHEITDRIAELATLADDPNELNPVTWI